MTREISRCFKSNLLGLLFQNKRTKVAVDQLDNIRHFGVLCELFGKTMNCIDRRRFLLSVAGLFGMSALSPELRGAGDDESELSIDFRPLCER
jgi:hypothetical protein